VVLAVAAADHRQVLVPGEVGRGRQGGMGAGSWCQALRYQGVSIHSAQADSSLAIWGLLGSGVTTRRRKLSAIRLLYRFLSWTPS
jgi:hypothetical protein